MKIQNNLKNFTEVVNKIYSTNNNKNEIKYIFYLFAAAFVVYVCHTIVSVIYKICKRKYSERNSFQNRQITQTELGLLSDPGTL